MPASRGSSSLSQNELVRVLLVEDSPDHAELISTKLRINILLTRADLLQHRYRQTPSKA